MKNNVYTLCSRGSGVSGSVVLQRRSNCPDAFWELRSIGWASGAGSRHHIIRARRQLGPRDFPQGMLGVAI